MIKLAKYLLVLFVGLSLPFASQAVEVYGFNFPNEAAGFVALPVIDNERDVAGLGYTIRYADKNHITTSTVYIYNKRIPNIPDGLSELLRNEAAKANGDVIIANPRARILTESSAREVEGIPYLFYKYEFPSEPNKTSSKNSYLYMMAKNNQFIKVRITSLDLTSTTAQEKMKVDTMLQIEAFVDQIAASIHAAKAH